MADLASRLAARAEDESLVIPDAVVVKLLAYFELLQRWNRKINLTSLSDLDEALDRLLLEPVAAAEYLPHGSKLADLGSGGGSPAIPLALVLGTSDLLMIESRSRKVAFLREVLREVALNGRVESGRFQDVSRNPSYSAAFDVVSVRAVALDEQALTAAAGMLRPQGRVALFRGPQGPDRPSFPAPNLAWRETRPLLRSTRSRLTLLFHVEHS